MRRWTGLALLPFLGLSLGACYTLQPTAGVVPDAGTRVGFDVSDAGRVALGGAMGPEIAQIEGLLMESDSAGFLLAVSSVRTLRGGHQTWSGEPVRLERNYLSTMYERRFSLARSIGLGAAGAGGLALLVTQSLLTTGTEPGGNGGTDTVTTRLIRP